MLKLVCCVDCSGPVVGSDGRLLSSRGADGDVLFGSVSGFEAWLVVDCDGTSVSLIREQGMQGM